MKFSYLVACTSLTGGCTAAGALATALHMRIPAVKPWLHSVHPSVAICSCNCCSWPVKCDRCHHALYTANPIGLWLGMFALPSPHALWRPPKQRRAIMPSCHHAIMPSCHHAIMPSCRHAIMPSCHHAIMPSCHHAIMQIAQEIRLLLGPASKEGPIVAR
eukprot:364164-Chlamydomonas_euryale.AAC.3